MQVWVKLLGVCKPVVRSVVSCICTAPVCRLNTSRRSGPIPATVLHFPVPVPNPVVITAVPIPHRLFHARAAVTRKNRSPMVWSRVLGTISRCWEPDRSRRSDSASVEATPLRQSIEDRGEGQLMEAPCCYDSGKRVRPVEIVYFPELATSGGPGKDVWRGRTSARNRPLCENWRHPQNRKCIAVRGKPSHMHR